MLQEYSRTYECLRDFCAADRGLGPEAVLRCVEAAALYAGHHHAGRFADGTIENAALAIGRALESGPAWPSGSRARRAPARRRILHVSPFVWRVGGHTRTLRNWIALDTESQHSVLLTRRGDPTLVEGIREEVRRTGGELTILPADLGLVEKAKRLRRLAQGTADLVVLHHTCHDVIPIAAFGTPDTPPVAFVNECDQAFWLGSSVADVVVNQRSAGARLNARRRSVTRNALLPIPLAEPPAEMTRARARAELGIPADQAVLLSIGRAIKYRPTEVHDFFRTVRKVIERRDAHLYVVGLGEEEGTRWGLDWRHPRIHLCGPTNDPSIYRAAADLYLESMPFGSATAFLEVALAGLPAVLPFDPPDELFVTNHGLETIASSPASEEAYLDRVHMLLDDAAERRTLGDALRDHVRAHHTGAGWAGQVAALCRDVAQLAHSPRPIDAMECSASPLDLALTEWHAAMNGDVAGAIGDGQTARDLVISETYQARWRGDHRAAFELLRRYASIFGVDARMLRAAGELPAHKLYGWIRRIA